MTDAPSPRCSSGTVYTDRPIFDAMAAATSIDIDRMGFSRIVLDAAKFIEVFNNHRDRALCTSLSVAQAPQGDWHDGYREGMRDARNIKDTFDPAYTSAIDQKAVEVFVGSLHPAQQVYRADGGVQASWYVSGREFFTLDFTDAFNLLRAYSLPSTDREYDSNVAPCDDGEFGMKP